MVEGRPFPKGKSGNPAGRPAGARHKTTMLAEKLMQDDAANIVNAVLTSARDGDMTAAKIICPVRKGAPVRFNLPAIETVADVVQAVGAVAQEMAAGELNAIAGVLEIKRRAIETTEFEARLRCVEEAQARGAK